MLEDILVAVWSTNRRKMMEIKKQSNGANLNDIFYGDEQYTDSFIPMTRAQERAQTSSAAQMQKDICEMRYTINRMIHAKTSLPFIRGMHLPSMPTEIEKILFPELLSAGYKILAIPTVDNGLVYALEWSEEPITSEELTWVW